MQPVQGFAHALLPIPAVQRFDFALHGVQIAMALGIFFNQVADALQTQADRLENGGVAI